MADFEDEQFVIHSAHRFLIVAMLFLTGCTYGPVEERVRIENGRISEDSSALLVAVTKCSYREPTGISRFPDGGTWRIVSQEVRLFRCDLKTGLVSFVGSHPAPESVWTSFESRVWSVAAEGTYVLLTGCAKGSECYGPQNRREIYLFDQQGRVSRIASPTEPSRSPEPYSPVVSSTGSSKEVSERWPSMVLHRFILDQSAGLLRRA